MPVPEPLDAERLLARCDSDDLQSPVAGTTGLEADGLGQERAVEALRFGIGMQRHGYNIFAYGAHGTGKHALVRRELREAAAAMPVPPDWCYVHNFEESYKPKALTRPTRKGASPPRHGQRPGGGDPPSVCRARAPSPEVAMPPAGDAHDLVRRGVRNPPDHGRARRLRPCERRPGSGRRPRRETPRGARRRLRSGHRPRPAGRASHRPGDPVSHRPGTGLHGRRARRPQPGAGSLRKAGHRGRGRARGSGTRFGSRAARSGPRSSAPAGPTC